MRTVDARGLSCPRPVVLTKKVLDAGNEQSFLVLVDDAAACENVQRLVKNAGLQVTLTNESDYTVIQVSKCYA